MLCHVRSFVVCHSIAIVFVASIESESEAILCERCRVENVGNENTFRHWDAVDWKLFSSVCFRMFVVFPFAEHKSCLVRLEWTIEVLNPTRRLGTSIVGCWLRCEAGHFIEKLHGLDAGTPFRGVQHDWHVFKKIIFFSSWGVASDTSTQHFHYVLWCRASMALLISLH